MALNLFSEKFLVDLRFPSLRFYVQINRVALLSVIARGLGLTDVLRKQCTPALALNLYI